MRTSSISSRCGVPLIVLLFALGLGCSSVPTHFELEFTNDCIEGARSLRFRAISTGGLANPEDVTWSPGIHVSNDPPIIVEVAPDEFDVTFGLREEVGLGETVSLWGHYFVTSGLGVSPNGRFVVTNVGFYPVPPDEIVGPAPCAPAGGPTLTVRNDPTLNLVLDISNDQGGVGVVTMQALQLVAIPNPLPVEELVWDNTVLATFPWVNAVSPGTMLSAGAPAIVFDLPDELPSAANLSSPQSPGAILLRYRAQSSGGEVRAVWEVDLTQAPVATESTTWGRVKALYRTRD